jgi:hypothetical protein
MYADNDWYGHKQVLADYCGLARPRPIFGAMRHGWEILPPEHVGERYLTFAPVFFWSERHLEIVRQRGVRNVHCVGAPFAYLARSMFPDSVIPAGSGTIAFPIHTGEKVSYQFDVDGFIDEVERSSPPPYSVSVFYQDASNPTYQRFVTRGWRTVSFGGRGNPRFLHQLASEMVRHSHVVSNELQTALIYGSYLRKSIRVIGDRPRVIDAVSQEIVPDLDSRGRELRLAARQLWPAVFEDGLNGSKAFAIGSVELGHSSLIDPLALMDRLGWSSPLHQSLARTYSLFNRARVGRGARSGSVRY